MFDDYAKKLKELKEDVPKIFERVAKKGAIKFVNEAKERTDKEHLVDTGNYKRSWSAEAIEPFPETYGVQCVNTAEYASFLERGSFTKRVPHRHERKKRRPTKESPKGCLMCCG